MAGSSWSGFVKTVVIPIAIALSLYVLIFLVALPLYRRHRSRIARYSDYTPLSAGLAQRATGLFEPYVIEPSRGLVQRARDAIGRGVRWVLVPGPWRWEMRTPREQRGQYGGGREGVGVVADDSDDDEGGGLFDVESGEAMVGFDFQRDERGRGRQRQRETPDQAALDDSNRRLGRELEEGFRDDSGSEASDEEVTVGRRSISRGRRDTWTG